MKGFMPWIVNDEYSGEKSPGFFIVADVKLYTVVLPFSIPNFEIEPLHVALSVSIGSQEQVVLFLGDFVNDIQISTFKIWVKL